jgi:hypothetical protein
MPVALHPDLGPLVGSWKLGSAEMTFADEEDRIEPLGPNPDGWMVLEPGGRVIFLFAKANRKSPEDDDDRAGLFNDMMAYTGMVRLDGPGRFITTVDLAGHPGWTGEQVRFFVLHGRQLTIRTPEHTNPKYPGRLLVVEVNLVREHD